MTRNDDSQQPEAVPVATRAAEREFEDKLGRLLSEHAQISRAAAMRSVVGMMKSIVSGHLHEQLFQIQDEQPDPQSFDAVSISTLSILDHFGQDIFGLARRLSSITRPPVLVSEMLASYRDMRSEIEAELILTRQDFLEGRAAGKSKQKSDPVNRGGKPLARHWDAVWAEIAFQLWHGDLQPKTQADIKRAMFVWFSAQGIDVGDTAVTQRARQLWQRLDQSK